MNHYDPKCKCGHPHSQHGVSHSINYSAGECKNLDERNVMSCKCKNFMIDEPY